MGDTEDIVEVGVESLAKDGATSSSASKRNTKPIGAMCPACGESFASKNKMLKHKRDVHGEDPKSKKRARESEGGAEETKGDSPKKVICLDEDCEEIVEKKKVLLAQYSTLSSKVKGKVVGYVPTRMTMDTQMSKVESEWRILVHLVEQDCSTKMLYTLMLKFAATAEVATQIPQVKEIVDLKGYANSLEKERDAITTCLHEIMITHPDLSTYMTPEARLALILTGCAVQTAANNQFAKNDTGGPPHSNGSSCDTKDSAC
jgi:hypothetical protein